MDADHKAAATAGLTVSIVTSFGEGTLVYDEAPTGVWLFFSGLLLAAIACALWGIFGAPSSQTRKAMHTARQQRLAMTPLRKVLTLIIVLYTVTVPRFKALIEPKPVAIPGPDPLKRIRTANSRTRAMDTDRIALSEYLGQHLSLGSLDVDEFERRVGQAYAATTYGQLKKLTADLPELPPTKEH